MFTYVYINWIMHIVSSAVVSSAIKCMWEDYKSSMAQGMLSYMHI